MTDKTKAITSAKVVKTLQGALERIYAKKFPGSFTPITDVQDAMLTVYAAIYALSNRPAKPKWSEAYVEIRLGSKFKFHVYNTVMVYYCDKTNGDRDYHVVPVEWEELPIDYVESVMDEPFLLRARITFLPEIDSEKHFLLSTDYEGAGHKLDA